MNPKIEINSVETRSFNELPNAVILMPENYLADEDHKYLSASVSFYKFAQKKGLVIDYFSEPELLVEKRTIEWFCPVLLFTSQLIIENPEIVSTTLKIITNYLSSYFKGQSKPSVRLKVIYKETSKSQLTEISYKGDVEGLGNLEKSISKIAGKKLKK